MDFQLNIAFLWTKESIWYNYIFWDHKSHYLMLIFCFQFSSYFNFKSPERVALASMCAWCSRADKVCHGAAMLNLWQQAWHCCLTTWIVLLSWPRQKLQLCSDCVHCDLVMNLESLACFKVLHVEPAMRLSVVTWQHGNMTDSPVALAWVRIDTSTACQSGPKT